MGSLEELTGKIVEDGRIQAQKIIDEAVERSKKELVEEMSKVDRNCDNMIKDAQIKAKDLYRQICAEKEIELRDKNLFIKQKVMDGVFADAFSQLKNLDIEEFKLLLTRMLKGRDLSNDSLILPAKYLAMQEELDTFLNNLLEAGKSPLKTIYQPMAGGFILVQDGIEENYTFESWLDVIRQEMEGEVLDILYGEED
jgi:V/A-type H+-transporting ATPase subunit E